MADRYRGSNKILDSLLLARCTAIDISKLIMQPCGCEWVLDTFSTPSYVPTWFNAV